MIKFPVVTHLSTAALVAGLTVTTSMLHASVNQADGGNLELQLSGSPKLVIDTSGNVGIGTTSPDATLELANSDNTDTAGSGHKLRFGTPSTGLFGWRMDSGNNHLVLDKYWTSWGAAMAINRNTGNVGIGTTSPQTKLDVVGQIRALDGAVDLRFQPLSAGNAGIIGTETNHSLVFRTNGTEVLRIDTSGNVGIGTDSPQATLDVAGTISATTFSGGVSGLFTRINASVYQSTTGQLSSSITSCSTGYTLIDYGIEDFKGSGSGASWSYCNCNQSGNGIQAIINHNTSNANLACNCHGLCAKS